MAMFPIFIIGLIAGIGLSVVYFHYVKSVPSNTKFKIQEEQLKTAQDDLRMFEVELAKAKSQIEKLKAEKQKTKITKKKEN